MVAGALDAAGASRSAGSGRPAAWSRSSARRSRPSRDRGARQPGDPAQRGSGRRGTPARRPSAGRRPPPGRSPRRRRDSRASRARASARTSSRAWVCVPPTVHGSSVSSEIPITQSASPSSVRSRSGECSWATYSRPFRRMYASRTGSASSARTRSASSSAEKPESTTPAPESRTSASGPPQGVVTTGRPAAIASAAAIPKPSWCDGRTKHAFPGAGTGRSTGRRLPPRTRSGSGVSGGSPTRSSADAGEQRQRVEQQPDVLARSRSHGRRRRAPDRRASPPRSSSGAGKKRSRSTGSGRIPTADSSSPPARATLARLVRRRRIHAPRAGQHPPLHPPQDGRVDPDRQAAGACEARAPAGPFLLEPGADPGGVGAAAERGRRSRSTPTSRPPRRRARPAGAARPSVRTRPG